MRVAFPKNFEKDYHNYPALSTDGTEPNIYKLLGKHFDFSWKVLH